MVYIKKWTDFETATVDLYAKSPRKARYTVKFQPKTGQLVLKVTDNTTCLMYKTFSAIILNRFESLNLRLLSTISNVRRRPTAGPVSTSAAAVGSGSAGAGTPAVEGEDPISGAPLAAGGTGTGPAKAATPNPAAGKKKKKGKR